MCIVTPYAERLCVTPRGPAVTVGGVHLNVTDKQTGHQTANVTLNATEAVELIRLIGNELPDAELHEAIRALLQHDATHEHSYSWATPR